MNAPIFISVIFSVIILMLPNYTPSVFNTTLILVISIGFFLPLVFSNTIIRSATLFYENNRPIGKKFLSLHGIIFLSVFQIVALLCSIDYLLSQFFGEFHNLLLIGIIVITGLISVTAGTKIIRAINLTASTLLLAGFVVLLVNRLFLHYPLLSLFNPTPFQHQDHSRFVNVLDSNVVVSVIALCIIIFWLMWLEWSELHRKRDILHTSVFVRSMIGSGIFLIGIFILFSQEFTSTGYIVTKDGGVVNIVISLCAIGGLIGLFISTFYSIGSLFAYQIYPLFNARIGSEKQILVNKLTTVFSVILAILLIPVVRNAGSVVITWYIYFLAICSSPVVVSFLISAVKKKQNPLALSVSIILGEMYALMEFTAHGILGFEIFIDASNIFDLTVASAVVTIIAFLFIDKTSEMAVVQKVLSRMKISRSTTL